MAFFGKNGSVKDWLDNLLGTATIDKDTALKERWKETRIKEIALYTAISLVADIIGRCERKVYKGGKIVKDRNWYVLNVSPNANQTGDQLIAEWIMHLYYHGDALLVPLKDSLYVADKYAIDEYPLKEDVFSGISIRTYQINKTFKASGVYYLKQYNPEVKKLVDSVFENYAELLEYAKKTYGQNSGEKYVLQLGTYPTSSQTDKEAYMSKVKTNLESFVNASSAAYPITKEQSLQRLSTAQSVSSASDYASIRKDVYNMVAAALHIPAGLLDGNITSVDQIINQTLTMAIDPLAKKISNELTRKTFSEYQIIHGGCKIKVDTTNIKHTDILDAAANIDKLIASGYASIDELREYSDMPEIGEEWSQKHYITKNYADIENPEAAATPDPASESSNGDTDGNIDNVDGGNTSEGGEEE
ncbi:MAG: phage portal protein [Lachnospiraceae bacterium]|nr:phage portal protein [Lachnospiraceae bacterium]